MKGDMRSIGVRILSESTVSAFPYLIAMDIRLGASPLPDHPPALLKESLNPWRKSSDPRRTGRPHFLISR